MRAWGAPAEDIARVQAQIDSQAAAAPQVQPFPLWPENARPMAHFLALRTQWVYAGGMVPQRVGFAYQGVQAYLADHVPRHRHRKALWADLQAMEIAVLQADAERRQHQANPPD